MITFNLSVADVLGPILGVLLPLLVAIVTKASTDSGVKAILLAALAVVGNLLTGVQDAIVNHGTYDLGKALVLGISTFVIAVATHYGLWRSTGVSEHLQAKVGRTD